MPLTLKDVLKDSNFSDTECDKVDQLVTDIESYANSCMIKNDAQLIKKRKDKIVELQRTLETILQDPTKDRAKLYNIITRSDPLIAGGSQIQKGGEPITIGLVALGVGLYHLIVWYGACWLRNHKPNRLDLIPSIIKSYEVVDPIKKTSGKRTVFSPPGSKNLLQRLQPFEKQPLTKNTKKDLSKKLVINIVNEDMKGLWKNGTYFQQYFEGVKKDINTYLQTKHKSHLQNIYIIQVIKLDRETPNSFVVVTFDDATKISGEIANRLYDIITTMRKAGGTPRLTKGTRKR